MARSAPALSQEEVNRKLTSYPPPVTTRNTSSSNPYSGTESDSDSVLLTPELSAAYPQHAAGVVTLSSIAEQSVSSDDRDAECDEGENAPGGWKAADRSGKPKCSMEDSIIKAGYLWKKGERRKSWQKRWFVLRPAHMAYYKTSAEYKLLRLLDLADVHSCSAIALKKHPNAFGLVSPVRTYYLKAESPEEAQGWVEAIEGTRQAVLSPSSSRPTLPRPNLATQQAIAATAATSDENEVPISPTRACITSSDSEDIQNAETVPTASPSREPPGGASREPQKILLSGYLMKCGSKRRNWRKRWFMLSGEKLAYSASHMDTKAHREFSFSQIVDALEYDLPAKSHVVSPHAMSSQPQSSGSADDGEDAKRNHTFKIVTTKRTLLLCAPSEEEEVKWLGAISALIARRSGTGATRAARLCKRVAIETNCFLDVLSYFLSRLYLPHRK